MQLIVLFMICALCGLAFIVAAAAVVFGVGWAGLHFIKWCTQIEMATEQWLSIKRFKKADVLDVSNKDRIAIVNYMMKYGMTYENAVKTITEINQYLNTDAVDPWHRDGLNQN